MQPILVHEKSVQAIVFRLFKDDLRNTYMTYGDLFMPRFTVNTHWSYILFPAIRKIFAMPRLNDIPLHKGHWRATPISCALAVVTLSKPSPANAVGSFLRI